MAHIKYTIRVKPEFNPNPFDEKLGPGVILEMILNYPEIDVNEMMDDPSFQASIREKAEEILRTFIEVNIEETTYPKET